MRGDGFHQTREAQAGAIEQEAQSQRMMAESMQYLENQLDFNQWASEPDIQTRFKDIDEITKNWNFGNFGTEDAQILQLLESMLTDVESMLPNDHKDSKTRKAIARDIEARIALSRGRGGFFLRAIKSVFGHSTVTTKSEKQGWFKR